MLLSSTTHTFNPHCEHRSTYRRGPIMTLRKDLVCESAIGNIPVSHHRTEKIIIKHLPQYTFLQISCYRLTDDHSRHFQIDFFHFTAKIPSVNFDYTVVFMNTLSHSPQLYINHLTLSTSDVF